ncbi:MAG: glycosyltransferase [Burkholderiales bacterium]|nr:glycosyltransferase [Anaerolineae bacterium]
MISLISTVLNEGESIRPLMESLTRQTRQPDEVVIVDGGSADDTVAIMNEYAGRIPLRVLIEAGCNISEGRNRAIEAAQGDIIAVTDAGVVLDNAWLERLTRPLSDIPDQQVVAGFFHADAHTPFEVALGATTLPLHSEINPATFLPSSRSVAFRKSAWRQVGGYPEWLDYCEDLVFDLQLKQLGPFALALDAVAHFRPRSSLKSFFRQYYLYARGDGKADLWRKRHIIRYGTYLVAAPLIFALGAAVHPLLWVLILPGAAGYLSAPYRRLPSVMHSGPHLSSWERLQVLALIPVIRVVGDVAKMLGYPAGWRWRLQQDPPEWRAVSASTSRYS